MIASADAGVVVAWIFSAFVFLGLAGAIWRSKWVGTTFLRHDPGDYRQVRSSGYGPKGGYYSHTETVYQPPKGDELIRRTRKNELDRLWPLTPYQEKQANEWRRRMLDAIQAADVTTARNLVSDRRFLARFLYWDELDPDLSEDDAVDAIRTLWTQKGWWGRKTKEGPAPATPRASRTNSSARAGAKCSCGGTFVIRTRREDARKFLGCSRYPECRKTRPLRR